jgi:hypothetical protein
MNIDIDCKSVPHVHFYMFQFQRTSHSFQRDRRRLLAARECSECECSGPGVRCTACHRRCRSIWEWDPLAYGRSHGLLERFHLVSSWHKCYKLGSYLRVLRYDALVRPFWKTYGYISPRNLRECMRILSYPRGSSYNGLLGRISPKNPLHSSYSWIVYDVLSYEQPRRVSFEISWYIWDTRRTLCEPTVFSISLEQEQLISSSTLFPIHLHSHSLQNSNLCTIGEWQARTKTLHGRVSTFHHLHTFYR